MRIYAVPEIAIAQLLGKDRGIYFPYMCLDFGEWFLISISDKPKESVIQTPYDIVKLQQYGCEGILKLFFHDIEEECEDYTLFSEEQALQVLEFLRKHTESDTLVVQCAAGVSRSGAIGLFASRYYVLDEEVFKNDNPSIMPNDHVYGTLAKLSDHKNYQGSALNGK